MIHFTKEQIVELKEKKEYNSVIETLGNDIKNFTQFKLNIPVSGTANWGLYYYCHVCSIPLKHRLDKPYEHQCSSCGTVYTGEPFDGSWWGKTSHINANYAYKAALMYMLTEETTYAEMAKDILIGYGENYKNYEPHGNIPYNNPGRLGAQTIDEAEIIKPMVLAYDIIGELFDHEEKRMMKEDFFLQSAAFMKENRMNQLHNHEVIVDAAIAMIGILYKEDELIDFAVYGPYGIKYQLEKGVLENGMWFEGSFGYHLYALKSFVEYEKFARNTRYALINHMSYVKMMDVMLDFLQPDGKLPALNDMMKHHGNMEPLEYIYKKLQIEAAGTLLNIYYSSHTRDNFDAFFYGVDVLPEITGLIQSDYHCDNGMAATIFRGEDNRYLLFKHGKYGGEHDHYDRLGISYMAYDRPISADLGTTGYGAKMHYDYFKNSATHNLVVIEEENQPPADGYIIDYGQEDGMKYVEAAVDFAAPYTPPDSFIIKQWSDDAYEGVKIVRKILWLDRYFVDLNYVDGADGKCVDWIMHFAGERKAACNHEKAFQGIFDKKPLIHLKDITGVESVSEDFIKSTYRDNGVTSQVYTWMDEGTLYFAKGPDNPTSEEVSYLIHRKTGGKTLFLNIVESYSDNSTIINLSVEINENNRFLIIEEQSGQIHRLSF